MNVKLLRKVKEHILAEPRRFVMWNWMLREENSIDGKFSTDGDESIKFARCGTAACIAGWTCIIAKRKDAIDIPAAAEKLLGISGSSRKLFMVPYWPERFMRAYEHATTQRQRVKIAADRIEHFIATKGAE